MVSVVFVVGEQGVSVILQALQKASEPAIPDRVALDPPRKIKRIVRIARSPGMVFAVLLNLLLLMVIGYDLTRSYYVSSGTDVASQGEVPPPGVSVKGAVVPLKGAGLTDWHPFGQSSVVKELKPALVPVPQEAPDTQLNLTLTGVLVASDASRSWATVQSLTDGEKLYATGEIIAKDMNLVSIRSDRIILEKGGRFETLRLPKSVVSLEGGLQGRGETPKEILKQLRAEFLVQPERVFGKFSVAPKMNNGVFAGYLLQPGNEAGLLEKLGLQPGDLLTVVNGVALTTPLKGMEALGTLEKSQALQLSLLRDGKPVTIHHTLLP